MQGVLAALATCHAADICYGDVKPANFMLGAMYPSVAHLLDPSKPKGDMALKAIDFGCSQYCPDGCSLLQGLSGTPGALQACSLCEVAARRCCSENANTPLNS